MLFLGIPASNFSGIFGMIGTTENFQVLNNIVLGGIEIVKFSLVPTIPNIPEKLEAGIPKNSIYIRFINYIFS